MASGPSGPPIPPSGNSDKGKGKKSYVVKLMTRFNNEIGSTSQPTTPTTTSTTRSVPPPLVVLGFTPTPHQVPTSSPTSIDPAEEERLRNRCWLEAAGGKYKGRVYDIGNLQQYGQQLQNLEGFIGVLLPFLPPSAAAAAQQFLNLPNPQVQNDVPNIVQPEQQPPEQQPPEQQPPHQQPPDEQPQDGNDYMHY
ncbi:hypothetical protein LR48_Vigan02g069200 [Vigna angularis]|uniref:Uncharacterized protein n=1 Tax=Phaseolus angularis TaxID=3914 RepID=A0A0L9TVW6_PHAAN|nr:hypothetical protein LR48_Vigan02g069200 [Vigna angularis]